MTTFTVWGAFFRDELDGKSIASGIAETFRGGLRLPRVADGCSVSIAGQPDEQSGINTDTPTNVLMSLIATMPEMTVKQINGTLMLGTFCSLQESCDNSCEM